MGLPSNEDLPPSYTEATTTAATASTSPATPTGLPLPSPLTTHLRTLPARLRATQLALRTAQASHDLDLTTLLIPHVESFLTDLTSASRVRPVAELTLVPSTAIPDGWAMSGAVERRREGEMVRVRRVDVGKVGGGEKGGRRTDGREHGDDDDDDDGRDGWATSRGKGEPGFDEWGRFDSSDAAASSGRANEWWFRDEDMARRLAAYLRPEANLERKHVQAAVVEKKAEEKAKTGLLGRLGLGGGRKKNVEQTLSPAAPSPASPTLPSPRAGDEDDSIKMTVRAEEVTFRKENEFGIWETRTGWGIVVTVKVKA
ncbi:uncharacterized protein B0T15DRAFT_494293 [Chaetomium strumarium]|uniref:Uncharacterized protein n=1 Tax=Chaetomium strumarium TaxID=1170767 RepID=A0AAJ0M224_9PEZI|nr:hypothetical protein B0T15DRAFT_494293 [Chaetomium strumarium]